MFHIFHMSIFLLKNCAFGHGVSDTTFIMSTCQPVSAPPTDVESSPPLSDEACIAFVKLVENYCVLLPKGQDTDDFHLETFRLCSAIGVSSKCVNLFVTDFYLVFYRSGARRTIDASEISKLISSTTLSSAMLSTMLEKSSNTSVTLSAKSLGLMLGGKILNRGRKSSIISSLE